MSDVGLAMMEAELRADLEAVQKQTALLMKLNKAELLCLAKHYGIRGVQFFTGPGEWRDGGKEELAMEIAEKMLA